MPRLKFRKNRDVAVPLRHVHLWLGCSEAKALAMYEAGKLPEPFATVGEWIPPRLWPQYESPDGPLFLASQLKLLGVSRFEGERMDPPKVANLLGVSLWQLAGQVVDGTVEVLPIQPDGDFASMVWNGAEVRRFVLERKLAKLLPPERLPAEAPRVQCRKCEACGQPRIGRDFRPSCATELEPAGQVA